MWGPHKIGFIQRPQKLDDGSGNDRSRFHCILQEWEVILYVYNSHERIQCKDFTHMFSHKAQPEKVTGTIFFPVNLLLLEYRTKLKSA
jgi:hypothetical protein